VKAIAKIANKVDHANDETKRILYSGTGGSWTTNILYSYPLVP